jgi:hypothetical protein
VILRSLLLEKTIQNKITNKDIYTLDIHPLYRTLVFPNFLFKLYRTGGNSLQPPVGLIWKDFGLIGTQVPLGTALGTGSLGRHLVARHSVAWALGARHSVAASEDGMSLLFCDRFLSASCTASHPLVHQSNAIYEASK